MNMIKDLIDALKQSKATLSLCPQTSAVVMTSLLIDSVLEKQEQEALNQKNVIYVDFAACIGIKGIVDKEYRGDGSIGKPFLNVEEAENAASDIRQSIFCKMH